MSTSLHEPPHPPTPTDARHVGPPQRRHLRGTAARDGLASLLTLLLLAAPLAAQDAAARGDGPDVVGTIEMVVDGETLRFDVVEGPVTEGFQTGYRAQPRGEAIALGASLHGRAPGSATTVTLSVGVWQASMEHMCDPFANQLRVSSDDDAGLSGRLRPGEEVSETCPPPEEGPGGLSLDITLTEAMLDESGALRVQGSFSGPLGRGDDARQVSEGRFEATLRPFDELMGSGPARLTRPPAPEPSGSTASRRRAARSG